MYCEHLYTGVFSQFRYAYCVAVAAIPARAYLESNGHTNRAHDGLNDACDQRFILQERGARHHVAHLLRRAAHVDVDDLRAFVHVVLRGCPAIIAGSAPAICTEIGSTSPSWFARRRVFSDPQSKELLATISETAMPAPISLHNCRNGRSVTPAIGATSKLFLS